MSKGAIRTGAPRPSDADDGNFWIDSDGDAAEADGVDTVDVPKRPDATTAETATIGVLGLIAVGWLVVTIGVGLSTIGRHALDGPTVLRGISIASGPLVLIVAVLILWQRTGAREVRRYADIARDVRMETLALDAVLSLASKRLAEDRAAVAEQADALLNLADQTSTKLRGVTETLAREIVELGRRSGDLDAAAGTARVDMGVLLADLPDAEAKTRALADSIRAAGTGAHEQAAALEAALAALAARARDAEDGTATAASRLSAQVSRIAGASDVATRGIDEAGQRMSGSIDAVLARAADAMERTRQGVATQSEAIEAMIERAQVSAEAAAAQAAQALEQRVASIAADLGDLAATLAEQDGIGAEMVERIARGLATIDARFAELDETGRARTERLVEALGALGAQTERVLGALNDGGTAATTLINRAETLKAAVRACLVELNEELPAALVQLERQAARSHEAASASASEITRLGTTAAEAAETLDSARGALVLQRQAVDEASAAIARRMTAAHADVAALGIAVAEADGAATRLSDSTSPKLVESLIRVRETAGQAAERAREALSTIIPHSAAALGDAGRKALEGTIGDQIEGQIARITALSQGAVDAANGAAKRLEEQLARVAATSASVEGHIAAGKAEVETLDRDNFARRVSLLIDSLNSISIDVSTLLAGEASDAHWQAYLKGDRGVFTRRAVKLLDSGEARAVARHYEDDAAFRDQVNRYVHEFEALLRPILATRDGSTLAVILLSSEMGKLYVALAQSIERLRA